MSNLSVINETYRGASLGHATVVSRSLVVTSYFEMGENSEGYRRASSTSGGFVSHCSKKEDFVRVEGAPLVMKISINIWDQRK